MKLKSQSIVMKFFRDLGLESVAWSLRRLHCPVPNDALVLEVGSGGNPYYRSNVLLDAYEHTRQRHFEALVKDRPIVMGYLERLPFKDKTFDFVIASHVLEHSAAPDEFLKELQRVAKSGYIETPDAFMERINPYLDHRSEITLRNDCLIIKKKKRWKMDSELVELYEDRANKIIAGITIPNNPFAFHVRYYWVNEIRFQIVNPEDDSRWQAEVRQIAESNFPTLKQKLRQLILRSIRMSFSQNRRNSEIDLMDLILCPKCRSENLVRLDNVIKCDGCLTEFLIINGVPNLFAEMDNVGIENT